MSLHKNVNTGEVRDLPDELLSAWSSAANPKLAEWEPHTPEPPAPVTPARYQVLKDTILQRIKAAGKLADLRQAINSLDEDTRFEWDNSSWFHNDNPLIVSGVTGIGLITEEILAPDPLAP